jgi:hypothetical protein
VRRPPRGRARVGRAVGKAVLPEHEVTDLIRQGVPEAPPIFVDPSGSRRRRLRGVAYAVGLLLVLIVAVLWVSQLSGPAHPPPRVPCPSGTCSR